MNMKEINVILRALRLYLNVYNFVYDSDNPNDKVVDYLVAAELLTEFKEKEKALIEEQAALQEFL